MQRYFAKEKKDNYLILNEDDIRHITLVMRMNENDKIEVVYQSKLYLCVIDKNITFKILEELESINNDKEIVLIIPLLKEQKMDLILQKATELGATKIIPVTTERTIIKIENKKDEEKKIIRWTKICKEAAEQSKRTSIPLIDNVKTFRTLNIDESLKIVCSTKEKSNNIKKFLQSHPKYDKINIVIGPEGGLSDKEEAYLNEIGFISVSLGNRIMRVETVPLFILSVLNYEIME